MYANHEYAIYLMCSLFYMILWVCKNVPKIRTGVYCPIRRYASINVFHVALVTFMVKMSMNHSLLMAQMLSQPSHPQHIIWWNGISHQCVWSWHFALLCFPWNLLQHYHNIPLLVSPLLLELRLIIPKIPFGILSRSWW